VTEIVVSEGFEVGISRSEVLRMLGIKLGSGKEEGERLRRVVDSSLQIARGLMRTAGLYRFVPGVDYPVRGMFDELERMAFCICTIGPDLENEVTALANSGKLLESVVLDSVGSVAADSAADYMEGEISGEAAEAGLRISCRASPGYGDWDIKGQAGIFEVLPGKRIGVELKASFMMIPRKSVSFAVDVSKNPARMRSENSCRNCGRLDCIYKKDT